MTRKSCRKHKGVKVEYDLRGTRVVCSVQRNNRSNTSILRLKGCGRSVHCISRQWILILKGATEEQRSAVRAKSRDISARVINDMKCAVDVMASTLIS